jgi:hypothetical protein
VGKRKWIILTANGASSKLLGGHDERLVRNGVELPLHYFTDFWILKKGEKFRAIEEITTQKASNESKSKMPRDRPLSNSGIPVKRCDVTL